MAFSASRRLLAAGVVGICCFVLVPLTLGILQPGPASAEGYSAAITPPPGSPARRAILDALRGEIKDLHQLDVIFVVTHLKVQGNWAFVHAFPQSADGADKYEDVAALMQERAGKWRVIDLVGPEVEDLAKAYPSAPSAIFAGF